MAQGTTGDNAGTRKISMLLVSKTGNGKSSLANSLLNTTEFQVGRGMLSNTAHCKCISTHARGRDLTIVDTPGTVDVSGEEARVKQEIQRAITFCPDGFDVFLVVIKCDARFTAEERQAIEVAAGMFGEDFYRHAILVFSHGDDYDNNEAEFHRDLDNIRRQIPYLDQLLRRCGERCILVDNGRRVDREVQNRQMNDLLTMADRLVDQNGGSRYTRAQLENERRRAEEAERRKAEEEAEMKRQERLQIERSAREETQAEMEAQLQRRREADQDALMRTAIGGAVQLGLMLVSAVASNCSENQSRGHRLIMISSDSPSHYFAGGGRPAIGFYDSSSGGQNWLTDSSDDSD